MATRFSHRCKAWSEDMKAMEKLQLTVSWRTLQRIITFRISALRITTMIMSLSLKKPMAESDVIEARTANKELP